MNQLKTNFNNGFDLVLDDIRFFDESLRDALAGLVEGFYTSTSDKGFKLSGASVVKNGNTYTASPGYVVISGEILKVEAQVLTVGTGKTAVFALDKQYDSSGTKLDEEGGTHEAYELRLAKLVEANEQAQEEPPAVD